MIRLRLSIERIP